MLEHWGWFRVTTVPPPWAAGFQWDLQRENLLGRIPRHCHMLYRFASAARPGLIFFNIFLTLKIQLNARVHTYGYPEIQLYFLARRLLEHKFTARYAVPISTPDRIVSGIRLEICVFNWIFKSLCIERFRGRAGRHWQSGLAPGRAGAELVCKLPIFHGSSAG